MIDRRFLAFLLVLSACDREGPRKPEAPISLSARIVGDPGAGCELRVEASCERGPVETEVVLPAGVTHLEGSCLASGEQVSLRTKVRAADRQVIHVRATLRQGSARLTKSVSVVLNDVPQPPPGVLKKNARGEPVLELTP